jgi:hypothetical protein
MKIFLASLTAVVLVSCQVKPVVAIDPAIVTLQEFATECTTKSLKFSIFCEATLSTGLASQVDLDQPDKSQPTSVSRYLGFLVTNSSMEKYFKDNGLDKKVWLSSENAKTFVKQHFSKGTNPWTEALTTTPQPPTQFELTTLAGTKIQVNWQAELVASLKSANGTAQLVSPSSLSEELNPRANEGWRQFPYLSINEISQPLQ